MKTNSLVRKVSLDKVDRAVLRASLATSGQADIAKTVGINDNKVTRSLLKLQAAGAVTLRRKGPVKPTPSVAAILTAWERLDEAIGAVLDSTLSGEAPA